MNCTYNSRQENIMDQLSKLNHFGVDAMKRYKLYHMDYDNCLLHGLFLPYGCYAFFVLLMGLFGRKNGLYIAKFLTYGCCIYYTFIHITGAVLTFTYFHHVILPLTAWTGEKFSTYDRLLVGAILYAIIMGFLEFYSHGKKENLYSNLSEFHISFIHGHLSSTMWLFGIDESFGITQ